MSNTSAALAILALFGGILCIVSVFLFTDTVWQEIAFGVLATALFVFAAAVTAMGIETHLAEMKQDQRNFYAAMIRKNQWDYDVKVYEQKQRLAEKSKQEQ